MGVMPIYGNRAVDVSEKETGDQKSQTLGVMLSPKEKAKIRQVAARSDLTMSGWARAVLLAAAKSMSQE